MSVAQLVTIELIHGGELRTLPATLQGNLVVVSWPMSPPLQFDRRTGEPRSRFSRRWRVLASELPRLCPERNARGVE